MTDPQTVYRDLRARFLELEPPAGTSARGAPYAILLEVGTAAVTSSVAATAAGDASLYLSNGGGMIGGRGVPEARESAKRMVAIAAQLAERCTAIDEAASPRVGEIALHLLTAQGICSLRQPVSDKFLPDDPIVALLREQGALLTALRSAPVKGAAVAG